LSSEDEAELVRIKEKYLPLSSHVLIMEVNALTETLEKTSICQNCHGPVNVVIKTEFA
jgi:hypothetical protein